MVRQVNCFIGFREQKHEIYTAPLVQLPVAAFPSPSRYKATSWKTGVSRFKYHSLWQLQYVTHNVHSPNNKPSLTNNCTDYTSVLDRVTGFKLSVFCYLLSALLAAGACAQQNQALFLQNDFSFLKDFKDPIFHYKTTSRNN